MLPIESRGTPFPKRRNAFEAIGKRHREPESRAFAGAGAPGEERPRERESARAARGIHVAPEKRLGRLHDRAPGEKACGVAASEGSQERRQESAAEVQRSALSKAREHGEKGQLHERRRERALEMDEEHPIEGRGEDEKVEARESGGRGDELESQHPRAGKGFMHGPGRKIGRQTQRLQTSIPPKRSTLRACTSG